MTKKRQHYWGTLILEGGVRIDFDNSWDNPNDVPDWIYAIQGGELPTDPLIWITETRTYKEFYIPKEKILAYCVDYCEED